MMVWFCPEQSESGARCHQVEEHVGLHDWERADEGTATRKYDGTCVLIRRDGMAVHAFARREVKPGKQPPPNFIEVEHDDTTGKTVGWEPAGQSGFAKIEEALSHFTDGTALPGTYELVGPKINGNPEGYDEHFLVMHDKAEVFTDAPTDFDGLAAWLADTDRETQASIKHFLYRLERALLAAEVVSDEGNADGN